MLAKLNFWYDKNHIARLDYYLNYVYTLINEKDNKALVRNYFEDTFGHYELNLFKEKGAEAHKFFNNYIYYPILENTNEYSKIVVAHLNGRKFLPTEEKERLVMMCRILDEYWKEDFEIPKSFKYIFKKISFHSIEVCNKIREFDLKIKDIVGKNIKILLDYIQSIDENIYNSLVDIYNKEKIN